MKRQEMAPPKSDCDTDVIWDNGMSSPATLTVFERDEPTSGLLSPDGKPLIRKRSSIGFVAFDD